MGGPSPRDKDRRAAPRARRATQTWIALAA